MYETSYIQKILIEITCGRKFRISNLKPFYSYVYLVTEPINESEAGVDLVYDTDLLAFLFHAN